MQWWQLAGALCLWPVLGVMAQENLPAGGVTSGELAAGQAARHVLAAADGELVFGQLLPRCEQVIISGASYGGLAAAWAGLTQDWIGAVYAQSGSFWWQPQWQQGVGEPGWLMREAARSPAARQVRWRLEAGLYEGGGSHPILESSRHLRDVLTAVGAPVQYAEFAAGHDRLHWLATLPYGVLALQ